MPRIRLGAVLAVALAAAFVTWLLLGREDESAPAPAAFGPALVSRARLESLAASAEPPLYWVGARPGFRLELTQAPEERVFVRYLSAGVAAGDRRAAFLTVGTYAQPNGFNEVRAASRRNGAVALPLAGGGLAVYNRSRPQSIYLSYPNREYQVELYDPDTSEARRLVTTGQLTRVGDPPPPRSLPRPISERALERLADFLDLPIHWAGARPGFRLELTQTPEGRVFLRYLPAGAKVGDRRAAFLTVATYPQEDGFAAVRAAARRPGAVSLELPGAAIAVFDRRRPTSVFLSRPGASYQVEVFHPDAHEARRLILSGEIVPIG